MDSKVQSFINQIAPIIQQEAQKRGYKICSTVIAQAIIESKYGESGLAKYHNYFGLKCGSSWKGASVNMKTKEEYTVGTLTTISDNFRAYSDMASGVSGYYDFISTKRYSNLKTAYTYRRYAELLKLDGYATSSTYVNTLCKAVENYNLSPFDSILKASFDISDTTTYVIGQNYTTNTDLNIRDAAAGNKVKYECITKNAKANSKFDEYGNAILLKGTKVTCKAVKQLQTSTWMQIPSGWICAVSGNNIYI